MCWIKSSQAAGLAPRILPAHSRQVPTNVASNVACSPLPEERVKLVRNLTLAIVCLLLGASALAAQNNIYIAQNEAGANSGADCSNARSAAWFNTPANWGTGVTQIGPGDTVHLCGTFRGAVGTTMLTVHGNGSAGSPITIRFENGATLASPAWGWNGAIDITQKSYITIDGGTSGIIQNTQNGTSLTYHQSSNGILVSDSAHVVIKKLTIRGIYANEGSNSGATDAAGQGSNDIYIAGNNSDISIHDNTLAAARAGISVGLAKTFSGLDIYSNKISDHCWGIKVGEGSGGFSGSDVRIHGNTITNWTNWQYPSSVYHTDGIIVYVMSGSSLSPRIYNNYIYGNLGSGSPTAFIFCTYGTSPPGTVCSIYNNVLISSGLTTIWLKNGQPGNQVYNNTIVGPGASGGIAVRLETATTGMTFKNNIVSHWQRAITSYTNLAEQIKASDHNVFYDTHQYLFSYNDGRGYYTLGKWQALGFDAHSSTTDPRLSSNYQLQSGSSAVGLGANLSSLGLPALNADKLGVVRAAAGACKPGVAGCWDSGALQASSGRSRPAVPMNLQAVVK